MSFKSTSPEFPSLLHVSFEDHAPDASLGAQLVNCDETAKFKEGESKEKYMFCPGYAVVGKLVGTNGVAKQAGVNIGDIIVSVNGLGFRRFARDYKEDQVTEIKSPKHGDAKKDEDDAKEKDDANEEEGANDEEESKVDVVEDHRVVPPGNAYTELLAKIKAIKGDADGPPLILTMERYGWDERANAWGRFLVARDNNVPAAMQMLQEHELWRHKMFPIDLVTRGIQKIMREKVISEIDVEAEGQATFPRTVYVNYGKLLSLQTSGDVSMDDIVQSFVIFTERMLAKSADPRHPKTCQFIDLSGVSITTTGFRVETLRQIYNTFEPNYPETLHRMVIYPVSAMLGTTARTVLSFVNDKTKKKFLITNQLETACNELGWSAAEVEECGGITEFMHKHEKAGTSYYYD